MVTSTSRHAIRALIFLANLPDGAYAGAIAIADEIGAPQNYLGKMLQSMTRQGLLLAHKGHGGGFRLARDPHGISLYDVVEPIEGLSRKSGCILGNMLCSDNAPCPAHKRYKAVIEQQEHFLKDTSIGLLADRYAKLKHKTSKRD
jgi:Rrf2 family protein